MDNATNRSAHEPNSSTLPSEPTPFETPETGAIAVASAVFLILELSHPYSGVIRLPWAPVDRLILLLGDPAKMAE